MQVETLAHAHWLIPAEPQGKIFAQHSIAIDKGRIAAILPTHEAREQIHAKNTLELDEHALIPGLINTHTHSPMTLFRGLADDMPLMTWLNDHIWPAEARWIQPDFIADGTTLAVAEMLRNGVTCFNDMYFFPDITAQVAAEAGMRAVVGLILVDFPSAWAKDPDDYLNKAIQVHDAFRKEELIQTIFSPHAPYSVSDEPLQKMSTLANELDLPVHMHVHETQDEIEQSLNQYGMRPLERLQKLNLLTPSLIAVHMTQLTDSEINAMAEAGSHVAHCPESNLKLASGFCPVQKLLEAGVNVALGTDSAASNNDLDILGEMRSAALLGKGVAQNASALPAEQVLNMATINGAKALGLDKEIGSLEVGKSADMIAIDLNTLGCQPVYNPLSQIVYSSNRTQVTDVWVAGQQLVRNGQLTRMDESAIIAKAKTWREKIHGETPNR